MSIEVKNLSISLAKGEQIANNISFRIGNGEMLAIVGGSGAGKTSVCKALMGLLGSAYHTDGKIIFQGKELLQMSSKEARTIYGNQICYIMQNPMTAFNPSVRIGKQLIKTYLQHHAHVDKEEMNEQIERVLFRLGLKDSRRILRSYPFALSGGMLQRLMIAAALINQPQVLIADEATTAIDACNRMELMQELRALCQEGMSILFVTHDLKVASYADYLLIMNHGKIIESGKTDQIIAQPTEAYTRQLLDACYMERRQRL